MLSQVFYRGPAIDVLHEEYAKRGRIDEKAPVRASFEVRIEAPAERVWSLISDPSRWPSLDSDIHDVEIASPAAADTRFRWSSGRTRLKSQFAVVRPGREVTWTGVSLGANAAHRHLLEPTSDGATRLYSEESMAGPLLVLLFNSTKLRARLEKWLTVIKTAAERR